MARSKNMKEGGKGKRNKNKPKAGKGATREVQAPPSSLRNKATRAALGDAPLSKGEQKRLRLEEQKTRTKIVESNSSSEEENAAVDSGSEEEPTPVKKQTEKRKRQHQNKKSAHEEEETGSLKIHDSNEKRGVIYVGNIPHGFYREQMGRYFAQYGKITRMRLARNRKNGHFKHYAFIEFRHREVAAIAAKSNNNYMLLNHTLRCALIPPEKVHPQLFKNHNRRFRVRDLQYEHRARSKKNVHSESAARLAVARRAKKHRKVSEKLASMGIDYQFSGPSLPNPNESQSSSVKRKKGSKRALSAATVKQNGMQRSSTLSPSPRSVPSIQAKQSPIRESKDMQSVSARKKLRQKSALKAKLQGKSSVGTPELGRMKKQKSKFSKSKKRQSYHL